MRDTRKCNLTLIRMLNPSPFHILDLSDMLLDVILETHAWAAARPKHEHQSEVHKLENQISEVMEREKEQGMCSSESSSLYSSLFLGMLRLPNALDTREPRFGLVELSGLPFFSLFQRKHARSSAISFNT